MIRLRWITRLALPAICLMVILLTTTSQAQSLKIGFVKDDIIKEQYKDWQKAQEQWQAEQKIWDDSASAKQADLETALAEYDKQRLILSDEKKKEREAALRAKKDALDAFTRDIYGPNGAAERKQATLIGPLLEKVSRAIEAVALAEGYDVIFTMQSGLGYIKETYDVTQKVLEQLDKIE